MLLLNWKPRTGNAARNRSFREVMMYEMITLVQLRSLLMKRMIWAEAAPWVGKPTTWKS